MTMQEKREKLREVLNSAEIAEIRHGLVSRVHELVRLKQDTEALGVESALINAHLYVINGEVTAPGLLDLLREDEWSDPAQVTAEFDPEEADEMPWDENGGEFIPTLEQIEEARGWLKKNGWPSETGSPYPDEPELGATIQLIGRVGWTRAMEMAREAHGEAEPEEPGPEPDIREPQKGDLIKCATSRRNKFWVHAIFEDRISLENRDRKELRPFVSLEGVEWDDKAEYWVITYELDPKEFLPIEDWNRLQKAEEVRSEGGLERAPISPPEKKDHASDPTAETSEPEKDANGFLALAVSPGDTLVVIDGEDVRLCVVGPIAVTEPRWARVLDPEQADPTGSLDGLEIGRAPARNFVWDEELDSWTVLAEVVMWTQEAAVQGG